MIHLIIFVSSLVVLVWTLSYIFIRKHPKGLLPLSTLPRPSGGNLLLGHTLSVLTPAMHNTLLAWTNELGPLYTFRLADKRVLVVSDPAVFMKLAGNGAEALPKAAFAVQGAKELGPGPDGIFMILDFHSEEYKIVRKTLAPAFSMEHVRTVAPIACEHARQLASRWAEGLEVEKEGACGASVAIAGNIDVMEELKKSALSVFLNGVLHMEMGEAEKNTFLKNLQAGMAEVTLRVTNPLRQQLYNMMPFLTWSKKLADSFDAVNDLWIQILKKTREQAPYSDTDYSLPACFWRLEHVHGFDDGRIRASMAAFVVAGFETNAGTVAWALYDIASHPEVQKTLVTELRTAGLLHEEGRPNGGRPITWDDMWGLPYFAAVLKESMRLHAIVATTSTIREADRDVELGGYHVPKGTVVWAPLTCLHCSAHNWEDPLTFKPERWLVPQRAKADAERAFYPFGYGPRNCIGQNLGNIVVRAMLMELISVLWFEVPSCMGSVEDVRAREEVGMTLKCRDGLFLQARPHRSTN
jgi:cytochrome P450